MKEIIAVAVGGAVGALIRYGISKANVGLNLPVNTFITNALGAVIIGIIVGMIGAGIIAQGHTAHFWKTGFCGGLTTFSTFSLETLTLIEEDRLLIALMYVVATVTICVAGVYLGRTIFLRFLR